ncbi:MAG: DUF3891 family protein [Chloroflexi bacterium]|nr:DUF3891 family protein [Chloroflexota bacterium]
MIRREEPGSIWVIHQAAHAYTAGQIAEHWVGNGNMAVRPREELVLAAYAHDSGWAAHEQQPRINGHGKPRTFTEMGLEEHFTIWRDSIGAVFAQNRYASLLTSMHCSALYEQRLQYLADPPEDQAKIRAFLEQQHTWEKNLITALNDHPLYSVAIQPGYLSDNLRLLQVWDYLSLLVCMSPVHEQVLEDVPIHNGQRDVLYVSSSGPRSMALEPYPLDQPLTLWVDARQVIGCPFDNDDEFRRALDGVPYKPLVFEIGPL